MIRIFTKKDCEKCLKVKKILKEKGLDFIEKSVESAEDLAELIINGVEISEAPVLEVSGVFYTNRNGLMRFLNIQENKETK